MKIRLSIRGQDGGLMQMVKVKWRILSSWWVVQVSQHCCIACLVNWDTMSRGRCQGISKVEPWSRMLIQFDHVWWILEDLRLLERWLWEQDLIHLEQSLLIIDKEIKQIVSILLSELIILNSVLCNFSQLCQGLFEFLLCIILISWLAHALVEYFACRV